MTNKSDSSLTFDGVGLSLENNVSGAERAAGPVVVDGGGLELPELGEQLLDVRVRHTKVQVGDHQFSRS